MKPHADRAARLLRSLANEQRLLLLCNLLEGPMSVGELNERVALSQSALSQHLAVLREAGVVTTERRAQSILYALPRGPVIDIIRVLKHEFCG
ncbi:MAG: metalloregulator ArsR/SmtB family transcription factor [Steroidobacteraceae bacterium]